MLLSLYVYFKFCFRHIQTYSSIMQEHIHAYSEICVSLACSEPWHIPVTGHAQTPRYIHNTISNISAKASFRIFDTVLNAPVSYRCYLTSGVNLRSLTLYFRHTWRAQDIQPYLFSLGILRTLAYLGAYSFSHTQEYSKHYTWYLGRLKVQLI